MESGIQEWTQESVWGDEKNVNSADRDDLMERVAILDVKVMLHLGICWMWSELLQELSA